MRDRWSGECVYVYLVLYSTEFCYMSVVWLQESVVEHFMTKRSRISEKRLTCEKAFFTNTHTVQQHTTKVSSFTQCTNSETHPHANIQSNAQLSHSFATHFHHCMHTGLETFFHASRHAAHLCVYLARRRTCLHVHAQQTIRNKPEKHKTHEQQTKAYP